VAAWIAKGLGGIESLEGQLVWRSNMPPQLGWNSARTSFTLSSNGDYRSDAVATGAVRRTGTTYRKLAVYDAAGREFREIVWQADDKVSGVDVLNIDQNTPVNVFIGPYVGVSLQADFGPDELRTYTAAVQSALTTTYPAIRPHTISFMGRPAWRIVSHLAKTSTFTAIVDRTTGLLLDYRTSVRQRGHVWTSELRLTELRIDPPLNPASFQLSLPAVQQGTGAQQTGKVDRFILLVPGQRAPSLQAAASALGLAPLVPTALPGGFHLTEIDLDGVESAPASAPATSTSQNGLVHTVRWPQAPASGVTLVYSRGSQRVVVSESVLARSGDFGHAAPSSWERVRLSSGALAGRSALIAFPGVSAPQGLSLYTRGAGLIVAIGGDLTASQLVATADSLEPYSH
jgi:hypothetical protein